MNGLVYKDSDGRYLCFGVV